MRATRRAARDDPDPQIHAKETILHLLRLLFLNITSPGEWSEHLTHMSEEQPRHRAAGGGASRHLRFLK